MIQWRLIPFSVNSASMNMAIDEAISEYIAKDTTNFLPTIRFYGWKPSAVSIGYFQNLEREIDLISCKKHSIDFVRRRTGGGAVYHDIDGEITYSIIAKLNLFPKDILASYRLICGYVCDALSTLGLEAEFKPINDIIVNNKKISGNAQTRRNGVLLQHGTILYKVDVEKMFTILKVPNEKIKDKMITSVKERVGSVYEFSPDKISKERLLIELIDSFTKGKDYIEEELCDEEIELAQNLATNRYSSKEWNFMR